MKTIGIVLMLVAVALGCVGGNWFVATNEVPSEFGKFGELAFLSFTPLLLIGIVLFTLGALRKR